MHQEPAPLAPQPAPLAPAPDPAPRTPDPALTALRRRIGAIAAATAARCAEEIPAYRELPAQIREGDLVTNTAAVLDLFLTTVDEGRAPSEQELALPIAWGAERARDGVPLGALLKIYPLAAREAWLLARAEPDDRVEPDRLAAGMLDFLGEVVPRVAEAYLREREDLDWEQREQRQHLAGALLDGRPARRTAERYGRSLADRYDIVVFRLPALSSATAGTRAAADGLRAVRTELDRRPEVLATFKGDGGVLLVPVHDSPTDGAGRLLARIEAVADLRCTAAAALAESHDAIPAAQAEAAELLALAEDVRRPPGLYRLPDLALEYQLARPGPARAALAGTLAPLAAHPHLLDTLREFIAGGYQRAEAAAALTVHRNTLTYRLGRIQLLTGYDPTRPADARRLAAALTAYDIAHHGG